MSIVKNQPPQDTDMDARYKDIFHNLNVGVAVVGQNGSILMWNGFMEIYSGKPASEIIGNNLFDVFPDVPRKWLNRKIQNVYLLNNNSYISWKDTPYVFKFKHNRPITGAFEYMYQDVALMPLRDNAGNVEAVCIVVFDMTDVGIYHNKLKEANDIIVSLEMISQIDGLTGMFNRLHFDEKLKAEFARSRRYNKLFSFIMFDLDHFKKVNDTFGHLGGDEVLRTVSARVRNILRNVDVIGRYGGEEFSVILPETNCENAFKTAEKLRLAISAQPVAYDERNIDVTSSFGVAEYDDTMPDYKAIIEAADNALYYSKRNGRNRVTCANELAENKAF